MFSGALETLAKSKFAKSSAAFGVLGLNFVYLNDSLDGQIEPDRDSFTLEIASTATSLSAAWAGPIYLQNATLGDLNEVVQPEGIKVGYVYAKTTST